MNGEVFRSRAAFAVPISYRRVTDFDVPPGAPRAEMLAIMQAGIDGILSRSSDARQVAVDRPHYPFPQQLVNEEVRRVLDLVAPQP